MDERVGTMNHTYMFEHEAMKTTYTLRLIAENKTKAENAKRQCIECIDILESKLSRHYEGGDIWLINRLNSGESLFSSEDTYDCLLLALKAHELTAGLFDCTLGRQIEHRKSGAIGYTPPIKGRLRIDPDRPAVHCLEAGREIDLGGIGKGYTLDRLRDICLQWEIDSGLLSSGASTHLAYGKHKWPISLHSKQSSRIIPLVNEALSTSGAGTLNNNHIISADPKMLRTQQERIWLTTKNAVMADAWSTAALLMNRDELNKISGDQICVYITEAEEIIQI